MATSARSKSVKQPEDRKPSIKDRIRAKKAQPVTYYLAETDAAREIMTRLDEARQRNALAQWSSKVDDERKKQLAAELKAAEKAFDACDDILHIRLRGLSSKEWSDLQDVFTVPDLTDEEKAAGEEPEKFKLHEFRASVLSIAAFEAGMTPGEWVETLASGEWSKQEVEGLFNAAMQATNGEAPSAGVPKG